jgi:carboxypeptidase T
MNTGRTNIKGLSVFLTTPVVVVVVAMGIARAEVHNAREKYSVVRVAVASRLDIARIAALGIDLEGSRRGTPSSLDLTVKSREIAKLERAGFGVRTIIPDWHESYANRLKLDATNAAVPSRVRGFHLGSMGGFLTLDEVSAQLDSMHLLYPGLISQRDSIGSSCEGRTLWGVRVSAAGGNVPCVLYTALHHAREPEGLMTVMYYLWYLLEQYGVRDDITTMLDTREIYVVPVVNPDGYAYNFATNPSGGGYWRKNRRLNPDSSFGVDLNRNYAYQWGFDDIGSSALGHDETYRGTKGFSEPETQAIRDLCTKKKPVCALNYHAYGNDLVFPWGYSDRPTPDSVAYKRLGERMTHHSYYVYGSNGVTVGYTTNGDADDWMYGDSAAKPRMFAMTPEVGGVDDGFWPLPSRIVPIADENLEACILFAQSGGSHFVVADDQPDPQFSSTTGAMNFTLVNVGLGTKAQSATISLTGDGVDILSPQNLTVSMGESTAVGLTMRRWPGATGGQRGVIHVGCTFPGGQSTDSISFMLGQPIVLFTDSADKASALWEAKSTGSLVTWGYTTRAAFHGSGSYAASPWGEYPRNYSSTYTLRRLLPLFGAVAQLRFAARWDIEPEYDFCLVEVSSDSGLSWTSLPGRYTRPGSGANGGKQAEGHWGYDRSMSRWVEERIDLTPAIGTAAMIRFRFESDSYIQADGFFLDQIRVFLYPLEIANHVPLELPLRTGLEQNYPNPFNPVTQIRYSVGVAGGQWSTASHVRLAVFDVLGRNVATLVDDQQAPGSYSVVWDASGCASGVYYYRLRAGGFSETKAMLLVR